MSTFQSLESVKADLPRAAFNTLQSATRYARSIAQEDGHWMGPMASNVTCTAEWIFLLQSIGRHISSDDKKAYQQHFLSEQNFDGSWAIAPDYPCGGDVSSTIEAYLALKILGLESDHIAMQRAQKFIHRNGGVENMRIFTRFYLAMFGLLPWAAVPQMPPELMLLPSWFPINIYRFSSWARITIVPFLVIRTREPVYALPNGCHNTNDFIDELWLNPQVKTVPYTKSVISLVTTDWVGLLFQLADWLIWLLCFLHLLPLREHAIQTCIAWLKIRQEASGDWAGIFPPMHLSIFALLLEGHSLGDDAVRRGLEALDRFCYQTDECGKWMQACVSPVWDTFLMARGLCDARTVHANDQLLTRALDWARCRQLIVDVGDWRVTRPGLSPGGFSFEYDNSWYPDVDDTAAGILAFLKQDSMSLSSSHVMRAASWICGMQNKDGGWAAFDVDNDALFLNSIPFSDMDALCDPSSADITGRVLEAFGLMLLLHSENTKGVDTSEEDLFRVIATACYRGITYLEMTQEATGAWYGRWGCNYVYGTSNVLCGLGYFSQQPRVRRIIQPALTWLKSVQNSDGGWGERLDSYIDPYKAGIGESTASQTAWGLMGLIAHLPSNDLAVERSVKWLISNQIENESNGVKSIKPGSWHEDRHTGTGFPGHFYLGYSLYSHYFPMMAIGRYLEATDSQR